MKIIALLLVGTWLHFLSGCATKTEAPTFFSRYGRALIAHSWDQQGKSAPLAFIMPSSDSPRSFYIRVIFPNPDDAHNPDVIVQKVTGASGPITIKAPYRTGWKSNQTDTYTIQGYESDPDTKLEYITVARVPEYQTLPSVSIKKMKENGK